MPTYYADDELPLSGAGGPALSGGMQYKAAGSGLPNRVTTQDVLEIAFGRHVHVSGYRPDGHVPLGGDTDYVMVYDGTQFTGSFVGSTKTAIANGYHFAINRVGGWPTTISDFRVRAFDSAGNVLV